MLQSGRGIHRVARDERVARARHDLTRVHADPALEGEALDDVADLRRRAHGAHGIILVRLRDAEYRHHRVADELLDGTAVALERLPSPVEVPELDPPDGLRVAVLRPLG